MVAGRFRVGLRVPDVDDAALFYRGLVLECYDARRHAPGDALVRSWRSGGRGQAIATGLAVET